MESQEFKLEQESNEKLQTPVTADALPSTFSSLSLDASKPKTFNDLPDELLDEIAAFLPTADLRSLALVEQRLYPSARRATHWSVAGITALLEFADVLLGRPCLGVLVRRAVLGGAADWKRLKRTTEDSPLVGRAIAIILDECRNLRRLEIKVIARESVAEGEALAALNKLRHLKYLSLPLRGSSPRALRLLTPILSSLSTLDVGFSDKLANELLPNHPALAITNLSIALNGDAVRSFESILRSLAPAAIRLNLTMTGANDITFAALDAFLPPYIQRCDHFVLDLAAELAPTDWGKLRLPQQAGWLYYTAAENFQGILIYHNHLEVGPWIRLRVPLAKYCCEWFQSLTAMGAPLRLEAHRGVDWTSKDVAELDTVAQTFGVSVVWV